MFRPTPLRIPLALAGLLATTAAVQAQSAPPGFVVAPDAGGSSQIRLFDGAGGAMRSFFAFEGYIGGVSVAFPDVTGDGVSDIVAGTASSNSHVKVFNGASGAELRSFFAFPGFNGGVNVAGGDVNGDGRPDLIVASGVGGGAVRVFDGRSGALIRDFMPYGGAYAGGVRVAVADVTGDGIADLVAGVGPGTVPHVKAFDGVSGAEVRSFLAFANTFTGGVYVGGGDVNGDGRDDIIVGADAGAAPHVKVFDGIANTEIRNFLAFAPGFTGGVRVAGGDLNGDGLDDIIVGAGPGGAPQVSIYRDVASPPQTFNAFAPDFTGGVFVAGLSGDEALLRDGFED
jgi:hypothetical protein